ncbi:MAG: YkvA family protein [Burkholderiaceae bacterium]
MARSRRPRRPWAWRLRLELLSLLYALGDREAPWRARLLALALLAYGLSPIDLIPDVIPFVGLLDDLLILPLGFWGVARLMPPAVQARARAKAAALLARPRRWLLDAALLAALVLPALLLLVWLQR